MIAVTKNFQNGHQLKLKIVITFVCMLTSAWHFVYWWPAVYTIVQNVSTFQLVLWWLPLIIFKMATITKIQNLYNCWLFIYRHIEGSKSNFELVRNLTYSSKFIAWIICYTYYECHWNVSIHLHVTLILMLGTYWYIAVVVAITTISKINKKYIHMYI